MGNKKIPDEVVTAMDLAKAAGWFVSNRNKMVHIQPPGKGEPLISIGHNPNDESMKVFRSTCRKFNLLGKGPARTRQEVENLLKAAEAEGNAEADRLNAQRRAYEAEQQKKAAQIEAARQKADAAIQQGLKPQETTTMPKTPAKTTPATIPAFDPKLMGSKDASKFLLSDGTYYCIECLSEGKTCTLKAPQGLAAHRSRWHQLYNENAPKTLETNRVSLPADVDAAFDLLRSSLAEALVQGSDPQALADKDREITALQEKLDALTKQVDTDRADYDKRFLEAQVAADKKLTDLRKELEAKGKAEVDAITKQCFALLKSIQSSAETMSPIQAIAKIDEIVRTFTS